MRKINVKKIMLSIEKIYGDSDLCSLLEQYADSAQAAIGKTVKYPDFFDLIANRITPNKLSDTESIATALSSYQKSFSFNEISMFYDYLVITVLIELNNSTPSDKELCNAIDYIKAIYRIEPDDLMLSLSYAEKILSENKYFSGSDSVTKNICRRNITAFADKFSISEAEAAKLFEEKNPFEKKPRIFSYIYFPSIWGLTLIFLIIFFFLSKRNIPLSLLVVLPLSEFAKEICDSVFSRIVKYDPIPKLKLSSIPENSSVICVITSLIASEKDVDELTEKIRNCYFSNKDKNVYFGLLCDLKESDCISSSHDEKLIFYARDKIEALNNQYNSNIYLLIRSRHFSQTEKKYMGWERKRGAVIELTRLLKGKTSSIHTLCGDPSHLSEIKYVITLDSDTRLYNGAVKDMMGAMLHPANKPVIENGVVVRGHAIMQPRMEVSLESAEKTPFAVLSSGNGGTDIYASAAYEAYQSIFDEGIFCGKGIFEVASFSELIDGAFPDETILSHDLLEGTRLRAAAITDISLTDNLPKNPLSCLDRQHRWIRGDIQSLMFAGKYVKNSSGQLYRNPISWLSKYKIYDNLRRALVPIFSAVSLILCIFLPEQTAELTLLAVSSYILFPCIISVISLIKYSGRRFFSYVLPGVFHAIAGFLYAIASLLQNAIISADAILRAGFRTLFSGKHMLEWKTASESEKGIKGLPLYLYKMLPSFSAGAIIMIFCPEIDIKCIGALWLSFPFTAYLIGREFKKNNKRISKSDKKEISEYAFDIWRFFSDNVSKSDSFLPPDNLQLSPTEAVAHRTSPTNIGLYLLSCVSAKDFGFIGISELISRIKKALDSIDCMQKWNGHLYNWYSTSSLEIIGAPYVSTVDSGNFVTCLVALKEALTELDDGTQRIKELIARISKIIEETDFSLLYDKRKKLFILGINTVSDSTENNCYDLFMSEARTTSYYAIASGQVPREHWQALSRPIISRDGFIGLASWTGTMFEYLMPTLLLPTVFGSLSYEAVSFAIREQRHDRSKELWGRSESGYFAFDADMNYQYKAFGSAALGMKRGLERENVISPYSSFLSLPFSPNHSLDNLDALNDIGMYGNYGFYEALDLTSERVGKGNAIIRSYMSHHMGMSIISCANACFDNIFVKRFMNNPEMASSAELLEEKIPINTRIQKNFKKHRYLPPQLAARSRNAIILENSSAVPELQYAALISENGLTVSACLDMLTFSASGKDISVDPFVFGQIHKPRLLFSADGKIYDALSSGVSKGPFQSSLSFRLDEKELMSEVLISVSGKYNCFAVSFEARGRFNSICPMFCFEPCLSSSKDRLAHPAYSDILICGEYSEADSMLIYSKKRKEKTGNNLYVAVSFESYGGKEKCLTTKDCLGLMYGEKEIKDLLKSDFNAVSGALINPFCAVKKNSDSKSGKYICNILISVGESRKKATDSILAARKKLYSSKNKNLAELFSSELRRTVEERLNTCCFDKNIGKYTEIMLTCSLVGKPSIDIARNHSIEELWKYGISGDLPIICLHIKDSLLDGSPARKLIFGFIAAHKYLSLSGVKTDLVLLYESNGDYNGGIITAIRELCDLAACGFMLNHKGGVFAVDAAENALIDSAVMYAKIDRDATLESIYNLYITPAVPKEELIQKPSVVLSPRASKNELSVYGGCFSKKGFSVYKGYQSAPWSYVYAFSHFGTLITQNSLGYTWIGNSHERRITPYLPDNLLDFSGEVLICTVNNQKYDLCACSSKVLFGKGSAEYTGVIENIDYKVTVSIDTKLPCKIISVEIPEFIKTELKVIPLMGSLPSRTKTAVKQIEASVTKFIPSLSNSRLYDTGFLIEKSFAGKKVFILGAYPSGGENTLELINKKYSIENAVDSAPKMYEMEISALLPNDEVLFDDRYLSVMTSYYIPYQALVCRYFGRTGFYQSGGAYGFRDQLQDCLCIMQNAPYLAKIHILRCASHQYEEGDVMHWWHTVYGISKGVRTRYSDDLLWLPYTVSEYIEFTGDNNILDINLPYISSKLLSEAETDRYEEAKKSKFREPLYYHCIRAIDKALSFGRHGLPLMQGGDWNDGMNYIGENGGESVWLGMFLALVLEKFIPVAVGKGDINSAIKYRKIKSELKSACEKCFSDNKYIRAYLGNGTALGENDGYTDILPQAFAAIIGLDEKKSKTAIFTATNILFDKDNCILKLLNPPFSKDGNIDAGYIGSYPEGIRENGGQYTHAAVWTAIGCSCVGLNELSAEIISTINPALICSNPEKAVKYRGEPYFLAGDVSSNPASPGRCGWSLYTGAAGWFRLAVINHLIGLSVSADCFSVSPKLSDKFPSFSLKYCYKETEYTIQASLGNEKSYVLDGKKVNNYFCFDKKSHVLKITVEKF